MTDTVKPTDTHGRLSVTIYEAQSGVVFYITSINLATLRAIQLKAVDRLPYPDKDKYRIASEAALSGYLNAEDNPQYAIDCRAVDNERAKWADRAVFDYAVKMPAYPTHDALVQAYAERLKALREIAALPDDDYEAVLFHLVLTWNAVGVDKANAFVPAATEYARIIQLAIQTVALTPDEVTAGVRFFRPVLRGRSAG